MMPSFVKARDVKEEVEPTPDKPKAQTRPRTKPKKTTPYDSLLNHSRGVSN